MGLYMLFITALTFIGIFIFVVLDTDYPIYRNMGIVIVLLAGIVSCVFVLDMSHFRSFKELIFSLILVVTSFTAIAVLTYFIASKYMQKAQKYQNEVEASSPSRLVKRSDSGKGIETRDKMQQRALSDLNAGGVVTEDKVLSSEVFNSDLQRENATNEQKIVTQGAHKDESGTQASMEAKQGRSLGASPGFSALRETERAQKLGGLQSQETGAESVRIERTAVAMAKPEPRKTYQSPSPKETKQSFADLLESEKKLLEATEDTHSDAVSSDSEMQRVAKPSHELPIDSVEAADKPSDIREEKKAMPEGDEEKAPACGEGVQDEYQVQRTLEREFEPVVEEAKPLRVEPDFQVPPTPAAATAPESSDLLMRQDHAPTLAEKDLAKPVEQMRQQREPYVGEKEQEKAADATPAQTPVSEMSKQEAALIKASSLIKEGRYLLAMKLLVSIPDGESVDFKKRLDLIILECMIKTMDYGNAQKKLFDVLHAKYSFSADEKERMKDMMALLRSVSVEQGT